jgi:rhomboid protease GluP
MIILALISAVGVVQMTTGIEVSVYAAGNVKPASLEGESWRLLTGALLHGGLMHFFFNFLALWVFGRVAEGLTGRAHVSIVFLVAAVAGSVASALLLPDKPSIGASGGILGVLAFVAVLALRHRKLRYTATHKPLVRGLVLTGAAGMVGYQFIDNAAHAGGALAGAILAFILVPIHGRIPPPRRPWHVPATVVALGVVGAAAAKAIYSMLA